MIKKIIAFVFIFQLISCAELSQVVNQVPQGLTSSQITDGLKEALQQGITNEVSKLAQKDGFYQNELTKILIPQELQKMETTLRGIGLGSLADQGVIMLNRAAEDAVKEATPIFVDAIKNMSVIDAKAILLGDSNAATNYLQQATNEALYAKFQPIINNSFQKVGADKIWTDLITKYNAIPLTNDVNPDLTNYVTRQALQSVFKMVSKEELNIRTKISSRTSNLLREVFALQDNK